MCLCGCLNVCLCVCVVPFPSPGQQPGCPFQATHQKTMAGVQLEHCVDFSWLEQLPKAEPESVRQCCRHSRRRARGEATWSLGAFSFQKKQMNKRPFRQAERSFVNSDSWKGEGFEAEKNSGETGLRMPCQQVVPLERVTLGNQAMLSCRASQDCQEDLVFISFFHGQLYKRLM